LDTSSYMHFKTTLSSVETVLSVI